LQSRAAFSLEIKTSLDVLYATGPRIGMPDDRSFETEGEAIESGLRRTMQGRDMVMRSLIQAV
jgi:hypothetical protein